MAHANIVGDRIEVTTQWNERELIKQVPSARWDPTAKVWHLNKTWSACIVLRGVFREALTIGPELSDWAWGYKEHVDHLLEMRTWVQPPAHDKLRGYDPKLYPFQAIGARFLEAAKEALLGDEMGTGKTIQVLAALKRMESQLVSPLPALVICPNSVKTHWARETKTWFPKATPYIVTGGAAARKKILDAAAKDHTALIIVNYEALRSLTRLAPFGSTRLKRCRECDHRNGEENIRASQCQVHPKELNKIEFVTVVVDEAHRIKDPKSQQTRAVWACAHQPLVRNRWALTGTPLANHPGDLWSILHCISPKDFPTKTHFVDRYCLQSWNAFGGLDIVGVNPAHRGEFFSLLDPRFRRMPKELVLSQLPPKIRSTRWVEMTPSQARSYRELETGLATMTSGGILVAPNSLIARMRMMQLSSSSVTISRGDDPRNLDEWNVRLCDPSPKVDELEVVLEEMGDHPAVVCAESRQLIDLAAARLDKLKISYGLITGPVSVYERERALAEFQAGKLRVLLFTIKAGGVGLTMTAADTIIFLQRSWSMIDNKQAEDRVHRIGSEVHESIHIVDIVTRDTVEEKQIASLTEKYMRLQEIARDRATVLAAGGDVAQLDDEEARIMNSEL